MNPKKVVITDYGFESVEIEKRIIEESGAQLVALHCKTEDEIIEAAREADALLVQFAPISARVIESLPQRCKTLVRYGIGVDNVDLEAATRRGLAVCNVPDYCIEEVADHALALALSLARQLPQIDVRTRSGLWKITPDAPMPAFSQMTFATAGFGRIARAVLNRAQALGFRCAAYDPFVDENEMRAADVSPLSLDELFSQADILSLHLPLSDETQHLVNAESLRKMKRGAILVNTARGALVDTKALASALEANEIGGAGLDVFETEPLENDHPLRDCGNTILTSHLAWYSESSVPELQKKAAQEIVRGLRGQALKNQVNKK